MRVLSADDSSRLVEPLVDALATVSCTEIVGQAGTAAEASEAFRRLKPEKSLTYVCREGAA